VENVEFELRLDRGEPRAPLRVTTSCSSHFSWIATILAECSAADPQMDLQLSLAATEQQFRLLSNNDVDLVITAHPPDNAEVQIAELFSLEVIALAAESHRLAQVAAQRRAVHWNALAGETLLIQNLPHSDVMGLRAAVAMRSQAARSLARHTIVRKVQLFEAIPALARTGRGVGVLCRWKRAPSFDTTGLAVLPLVPQWWRRFCAVWRQRQQASAAARHSSTSTPGLYW
jgi:DNA-binding transcriptional LysR family regulator